MACVLDLDAACPELGSKAARAPECAVLLSAASRPLLGWHLGKVWGFGEHLLCSGFLDFTDEE